MNRALRFTLLGLAVVVVLFAVTLTAIPSGATREATAGPSAADRLVFSVYHCSEVCDRPIYSANSDGSDLRTITLGRFPKNRENPAWSPDGKTIAYDWLEGIYLKGARGGAERLLRGTELGDSPRWSPDGTRIVYTSVAQKVRIAIVSTGGGRPKVFDTPRWVLDPDWSPDGMRIAFTDNASADRGAVYVMNLGTGVVTKVTRPPMNAYDSYVRWSPDGKRLLFARGTGVFTVSARGGPLKLLFTPDPYVTQLSWSPDGQRIAYANANGKIHIFDLASRRHRLVRLKPCMGSGRCYDVDW